MELVNTLKFIANHPLNRDRKCAAVLRFARWQIRSRMADGAVAHDWINGAKLLIKRGETGLTQNIYTGLQDFTDMAYVLHVLRRDELFVDVGANSGAYTILACAAAGCNGIAFEPVPHTYQRLVENVGLNHLEARVRCLNQGVGAESGALAFTADHDTTNHAVASGEATSQTVKIDVTTLDAALGDECPAMLKIDVEGYEKMVLDGAKKVLECASLHSIIMELNGSGSRYGIDESLIFQLLLRHGFEPHVYDPFTRVLSIQNGRTPYCSNTLFIRDKDFVTSRLKTAPRVSILGKEI